MSDFFDTYFNINKIMKGKKEYKEQMARVKALPEEYWYVYDKMLGYMWKLADGDGNDMLKVQYDLIDLFEAGAAEGKPILDVTGEDVAAFADELLLGVQTYIESWRKDLNRDIHKKVGKGHGPK